MRLKSTKYALLFSALSLVLCLSMFVGSTFAWFNDSVTFYGNKIKTGTLDLQLLMHDGTDYVDISTTDKPIFSSEGSTATQNENDDALWEPGKTQIAYLAIKNNGDLALKYKVALDVYGVEKNLNEALQYVVIPNAQAGTNPINDWRGVTAQEIKPGIQIVSAEDISMAAEGIHYFALAIHMPDNAADRYQDGKINFDLTVLATQTEAEMDSFDSKYDPNAAYPIIYDHVVDDVADLKLAFAQGGNVRLENDLVLDETLIASKGTDIYLNLNGKTLTVDSAKAGELPYLFYTRMGSRLVIDGEGTVNLGTTGMALIIPCGDVIIENGTFIRTFPTTLSTDDPMAFPLISGTKYAEGIGSTVINGGYFDGGYYDAKGALSEFKETDAAGQGKPVDTNEHRIAIKNNVIATLNLSAPNIKVYGGTFVGMNPAWGDEGCALPKTPAYLRPWSNDQGAFLEGQEIFDDKIVLPAGYEITEGVLEDGRPTFAVKYTKPETGNN